MSRARRKEISFSLEQNKLQEWVILILSNEFQILLRKQLILYKKSTFGVRITEYFLVMWYYKGEYSQ
jgi:hypothetical protein